MCLGTVAIFFSKTLPGYPIPQNVNQAMEESIKANHKELPT